MRPNFIGIDIVKVSRMKKLSTSYKVFNELEHKHCKNLASYAGVYAAKEAIRKIDPSLKMSDIEVLYTDDGEPFTNIPFIEISISHEKDYAVAVAISRLRLSVK
ncbi:MAG: 4'-phosphopantetheinyl transferase superfamily protein [Candidatus Paceibacterota bacterium]|jgi:phosphopantetheinyl transferase (holo-ACP synthase)